MIRKVLRPYTLSDGTFLPTGTFVSASLLAVHRDAGIYERPNDFEGFRFAEAAVRGLGEGGDTDDSDARLEQNMASTGSDYLAFGYGRHAWCVSLLASFLGNCDGMTD